MNKLIKRILVLSTVTIGVLFFAQNRSSAMLMYDTSTCKIDIIQCSIYNVTRQLCHEAGDTITCSECGYTTRCKENSVE